jgi:poly-beta-1,6-N-acetyl-D-glucosamine synthase
MIMVESIFWFSFLLLFYIYAGYPLLMALRAKLFPRPVQKAPFTGTCSVLIAARNEAANLSAKIASLHAQTVHDRIVEILVGSDGSTDGTVDVLLSLNDARIKVFDFPKRRGKPSVLNDLMRVCSGDVVIMCDARQRLDARAIEALLACFSDPSVGVVSGELIFIDPATSAAVGMDTYWRYEKWIRKSEAMVHSVPGATGALYAIRKSLLKPIPEATLLDDVAIPIQAVVAGGRCIFEPAAIVYDHPSKTSAQEGVRKRRTIAGVVQLMGLYPGWLLPWRNPVWFAFLSHKVFRLLSPFCLISLAVTNGQLLHDGLYRLILGAQVVFYGLALAGWALRRTKIQIKLLSIPMMFASLNVVTLMAWGDAIRGKFRATWEQAYE